MESNRNSQQPGQSFALAAFAAREQHRIQRLIRACYGVGHTHHPWFMALPRAEQESKVMEWAENSLKARAIRLGQSPNEWGLPEQFLEHGRAAPGGNRL